MTISIDQIFNAADELVPGRAPRDNQFTPILEKLVESLQKEGNLTAKGETDTINELATYLRNQYEIEDWIARVPEIVERPIEKPVLFMGLPRSGTTYLLNLFDFDQRLRLLRTWEGLRPCPPPALDAQSVKDRIVAADRHLNKMNTEVETFSAMHLLDVEGPDECTQLLSTTFGQVGFNNYLRVPTWFDWLMDEGDFLPVYEYHKKQLQILQWGAPERRWALKYPNHVLALDAIQQVYPDAAMVFPYRDPDVTLASICNLTHELRSARMESNKLDVGKEITHFILRHVECMLNFRNSAAANDTVIVDVDYYEMMQDPVGIVSQIYGAIGMEMTPEVNNHLSQWTAANPKGKRGKHVYKGDEFGLDPAVTDKLFSEFRQRFHIPRESEVS